MGKFKDITGQRFGRLTALCVSGRRDGCYVWRCRCDCGAIVEVEPEIGNLEQIALLQKIERERTQREKDANDGRLDAYIHVEDIKYKVVCECKDWSKESYVDTEDGRTWKLFPTPREAFATLIDKVSGRGTWKRNPWVVVYEFELVK